MREAYYTRAAAKRRYRERQVRRNILLLVLSIILVLLLSFLWGGFFSQASDLEHKISYKYYKSVEIMPGDTLWAIAEEYSDTENYASTIEYIEEVKRMNSLKSNTIHAGNYLIVPYYSTEFVK
ncbi:MAG: LysM peptidoglycan-binding domain-containing protein [Lachnospiraceae bacterium]|nr:LysM peptidoglycan-binding domain-containing protein [Lachnospiraceae bacterium]